MPSDHDLPEGAVKDAVTGNWVDTHAPAWTRPFLRLSRADRPIGTWLLFIPCIWSVLLAALSAGHFYLGHFWIILSCGIGAFLMRGAGCTWNDFTDRHIDGSVERTRSRPLPSGQVSVKMALLWMAVQALLGFLILISYNSFAIWVGVASLFFVGIYPFAKRFTWWPQLFLGLAFNWGALLGWAAHGGSLGLAPLLLYFAGIIWTLFYDTIYAHQDVEDDALIGVKSTARLFGEHSDIWLRRFIAGSAILLAAAVSVAGVSGWALWLSLAGVAGFTAHLFWQLRRFDAQDPARLLRLFRSNRDAGLIFALFLALALFL